MSKDRFIRAWKDPRFRETLRRVQSDDVPESPVGAFQLDAASMGKVSGGQPPTYPAPICALSIYPKTSCHAGICK